MFCSTLVSSVSVYTLQLSYSSVWHLAALSSLPVLCSIKGLQGATFSHLTAGSPSVCKGVSGAQQTGLTAETAVTHRIWPSTNWISFTKLLGAQEDRWMGTRVGGSYKWAEECGVVRHLCKPRLSIRLWICRTGPQCPPNPTLAFHPCKSNACQLKWLICNLGTVGNVHI